MSGGAPARLRGTVAALDDWLARRFALLTELGEHFISVLALDAAQHIDLTDGARRRMKASATRYLAEHPVVDGCGLIFAHSALGTENGHLEWWVREEESRFARYSFGVVPGADRYYDYEHHEWFVRAFHDGAPAMVGPYIDYLGVESYVLTLTVPAELDGVRIGAIGNDITVADLETELLPLLLAHDEPLAVLGRHGSVLCSNTATLLPGAYVPEDAPEYQCAPLEPRSTGIRLVYAR